MYTQIDNIIDSAIHYRNRQIIFRFISTEKNRTKYLAAAREMNARKNALATAIAKGTKINNLHSKYNTEER